MAWGSHMAIRRRASLGRVDRRNLFSLSGLGMTAAAKRSLLLLARNETEPTLLTHVRATIRSHRRFLSSPAGPSSSTSSRVVIFSGIQPTERPHIGNYLGALRQWVKLQNEAPPSAVLIYSIVNLHAFTIRRDPQERRKWQRETLATLLAVGLNPKRAIIFYQSHVRRLTAPKRT